MPSCFLVWTSTLIVIFVLFILAYPLHSTRPCAFALSILSTRLKLLPPLLPVPPYPSSPTRPTLSRPLYPPLASPSSPTRPTLSLLSYLSHPIPPLYPSHPIPPLYPCHPIPPTLPVFLSLSLSLSLSLLLPIISLFIYYFSISTIKEMYKGLGDMLLLLSWWLLDCSIRDYSNFFDHINVSTNMVVQHQS